MHLRKLTGLMLQLQKFRVYGPGCLVACPEARMSSSTTLSAPVDLATVTAWQAYQDEVTTRRGTCCRRGEPAHGPS